LAALHVGIQIGAAGNELCSRPNIANNLHRFRDGARHAIFKFRKTHHKDLNPLKSHPDSTLASFKTNSGVRGSPLKKPSGTLRVSAQRSIHEIPQDPVV